MIYLKCKKCGKNICVFDKRKAQSFTCLRDEGCHGNCQPQKENMTDVGPTMTCFKCGFQGEKKNHVCQPQQSVCEICDGRKFVLEEWSGWQGTVPRKRTWSTILEKKLCPSCQPQQENLGRAFRGTIKGTSDIPEATSELCNTKDCKCHAQPQQEQKDDIDKLVEKLESGFPQQERSVEMTEDILKQVAIEANLDQFSLVLFHDCVTASNSKDGIENVRNKIGRLVDNIRADERKKVVEEAIKTVNECQVYDVVSSGSELLIKHHIVSRLSNLSKDL